MGVVAYDGVTTEADLSQVHRSYHNYDDCNGDCDGDCDGDDYDHCDDGDDDDRDSNNDEYTLLSA